MDLSKEFQKLHFFAVEGMTPGYHTRKVNHAQTIKHATTGRGYVIRKRPIYSTWAVDPWVVGHQTPPPGS